MHRDAVAGAVGRGIHAAIVRDPRAASRAKSARIESGFSRAAPGRPAYDAPHRHRRGIDVKELSIEEVLRIAGGVPAAAALDEITYRAAEEAAMQSADRALSPPATTLQEKP
jgi:hypothetical protein